MRYIDIAVATLVGVSAITGVLLWTPRGGDTQASALAAETELRDRVAGLIEAKGMVWFIGTPPSSVCSYIAGLSNSTIHLLATVGGATCGSRPAEGAVRASLSFRLVHLQVTVEAWSNAVP